MTSGIYKLKFEGTSKVYIGQSVNIEKRFKEHIRSLKNRTSAKKLLSGFDTFGHPSIVILEECKDKDLMSLLENSYIQTYESFVSGFNSLEHAEDTPISFVGGCEASAAIYSKK
jgi:group I intron endonuclease